MRAEGERVSADLSPEEFRTAFEGLSPDNRLKLTLIERPLLRGTSFRSNDILNEAVCRTLLGRRRCPREVPVMAFLVEVMRSIASHEREREKRMVSSSEVGEFGTPAPVGLGAMSRAASAEDMLIEMEEAAGAITMKDILALFEDDAEATAVLRGLDNDLKGKGLRERTGLDQGRLDYAKKRIKKVLLARFPEGWRR